MTLSKMHNESQCFLSQGREPIYSAHSALCSVNLPNTMTTLSIAALVLHGDPRGIGPGPKSGPGTSYSGKLLTREHGTVEVDVVFWGPEGLRTNLMTYTAYVALAVRYKPGKCTCQEIGLR